MYKKILGIVLLCSILIFALAGCNDDENDQVLYICEERNQAWEEDVRFFAYKFMMHPLLTNDYNPMYTLEHKRQPIPHLRLPRPLEAELHNFYDPQLREYFEYRVEALIARIPYMHDFEIFYGMGRIATLLGDAHSDVHGLERTGLFPIFVWPFDNGRLYVIGVSHEHEYILHSELLAINGIALDKIFAELVSILPAENKSTVIRRSGPHIQYKGLLRYIGVMCNDDSAEFAFMDREGGTFTVELSVIDSFDEMELTLHEFPDSGLLNWTRASENYWHELLPCETIMYLRFSVCEPMENLRFPDFLTNVRRDMEVADNLETLIVDLRGNLGGRLWRGLDTGWGNFIEWLNADFPGNVYIAIDNRTYSGGVTTASLLRQEVTNALLIGEPAGQPPNFFFGFSHQSPNFGLTIDVSTTYGAFWPGYEADELLPDIFVFQTFEEFLNLHDPVLEAILSGTTR